MRFIDLFAGLGGFHKALHDLNHECVFASELDPTLRQLYKLNWGIEASGDIRKIVKEDISQIPEHDILCAGFPCQPFSKAGKQLGRNDTARGTLFDEIVKILSFRKPNFFILENVPYIAKHDNEVTWNQMFLAFKKLGYEVDFKIYSPQDFGIPQHRKRVFIIGSLVGLEHFNFGLIDQQMTNLNNINDFVELEPINPKYIPQENLKCLELWQDFLNRIPEENKIPGFPIWSMEFGATYPFEETIPHNLTQKELAQYKGNFGCNLEKLNKEEQLMRLPSYARVMEEFPIWKKNYIIKNRLFYKENKRYIKNVVKQISKYQSQSWQKLEWNVGEGERNIFNYILQFRASGIRVKKTDYFPSLVCTNTQIPIIGWQNRYLSKNEGLRLQSLEGIVLPNNDTTAFKALGNAVNASIVRLIAEHLIVEVNDSLSTLNATG